MYRNHENPYVLKKALENAKKQLAENPDDLNLYEEVSELEERIDFAWQDAEE